MPRIAMENRVIKGIRWPWLRVSALLLAAGVAAAAQGGSVPAPPPAAPQGMGPRRALSEIPAAKLATLRQLATLTLDFSKVRAGVAAPNAARDHAMLTGMQQKGLSAARAQDFVDAFNKEFPQRVAASVNNDTLIQMLDATYSADQATQLVAFYHTPLGERVAQFGPLIIEASAGALQQQLNQIGAAVVHDISGSFPELNSDTSATPAGELPRPSAVETSLYPPVASAKADVAAAQQRAAANGHRVLVIFGANWCYDCHVLDTALHSPAYAPLLAGYETVNINVGDSGQDNLDLARQFGVDVNKGVPALAVLDAKGAVLVAQKQGEFQDARTLKGNALTAFLQTWAKR